MKILIGIVSAIAILWLLISVVKSPANGRRPQYTTVAGVPSMLSKVRKTGKDGSFVVFLFSIKGNNDELLPNIQYSIENGALGFDWVLIAPQNIKDEDAIRSFLESQAYVVKTLEMNDVRGLSTLKIGQAITASSG